MEALSPGTRVEKYVVLGPLGAGGMASVHAVQHTVLGSRHALKLLHTADASVARRLLREGRVQAQLEHPNLVPVQDVLDVGGNPALLMPLVEGPSLRDLAGTGPLQPEDVGPLFAGIVRGVAHAHAHGVVHRDLKPGNVMLEVRHHVLVPRVADFGLATALGPEDGSTRTGAFMGTPAYAAPEQLHDASSVDHRADLWSLGCILYELLAGAPPFRGTLLELVRLIGQGSYRPLTERRPELDPRWSELVDDLLVVDRDARLPTAAALLERLDALAEDGWSGSLEGALLDTARTLTPRLPTAVSDDEAATRPPVNPIPPAPMDEATTLPPKNPFPELAELPAVASSDRDSSRAAAPDRPSVEPPAPAGPTVPRRGSRRLSFGLLGLAVLGAGLGGGWYWDRNRSKTTLHPALDWAHGEPVGLGNPAEGYQEVYALHWRGGAVQRVDHQTLQGAPRPWPDEADGLTDPWTLDGRNLLDDALFPCEAMVPDGDGEGQLTACGAFNAQQVEQPTSVELVRDDAGQLQERRWLTATDQLVRREALARDGPWRVWSFFDPFGNPKPGSAGPRRAERWDEAGRVVEVQARALDGTPLTHPPGVRRTLDPEGRVARVEELPERGASARSLTRVHEWEGPYKAAIAWLDATEAPALGDRGCARIELDRDPGGRLVAQRCLDRDGSLVEDLSGCATWQVERDGHRIRVRCEDREGTTTTNEAGFAEVRLALDADGQLDEARFFDPAGEPTHPKLILDLDNDGRQWTTSAGPARLALLRDAGRWLAGVRWFDTEERPMRSPEGWYGWDLERNGLGRVTKWTLRGAQEEPVLSNTGFASMHTRRTASSAVLEARFFGADGEPVEWIRGYHIDRNVFVDGRMTSWTRHDVDGEPVVGHDGAYRIELERDALGRPIRKAFFGLDEQPITSADGPYHEMVLTRTADGRLASVVYRGLDGELAAGPEGCARREHVHEPGGVEEVRCFGVDGEPTASERLGGGARARITKRAGKFVQSIVYAADGAEMTRIENLYDERMHLVGTDRWDGNGTLTSRTRQTVDGAGRPLEERTLDADGALVADARGVALSRSRYDARGNRTLHEVFGADGAPTVDRRTGVYRTVSLYDDMDHIVEERLYGVRGEPVSYASRAAHLQRYERDAMGQITRLENHPVPGGSLREGVAPAVGTSFDDRGHVTELWVEDREGRRLDQPEPNAGGAMVSTNKMTYDEQGLLQTADMLRADDSPALCEAGFASVVMERPQDVSGRTRVHFEDGMGQGTVLRPGPRWNVVDDNPTFPIPTGLPDLAPEHGLRLDDLHGMAGWELDTGSGGLLVAVRFLGPDRAPTAVDGVVGARQSWSPARRPVRVDWVDAEGSPAVLPLRGVASTTWAWDDQRRLVRTDHLDPDGAPMDGPEGWASHRIVRDGYGNPIRESYWRADGSPARNPDGCHLLERSFRWTQQLSETCESTPTG